MTEATMDSSGAVRRRFVSLPVLGVLAAVAVVAIGGGAWLAVAGGLPSSSSPSVDDVAESSTVEPNVAAATEAYESGDFTGAETALGEVIAADAEDLDARRALALTLSAQGKNDEALAEYAVVVAADPQDHESFYRMAMLERLLGMSDEAVGHLEAAVAAEPAAAYLDDLARTYMQMGRYDDAVASWQRVLDAGGMDEAGQAGVYAAMATAHEGARQYDDAKGALEKALHLLPNDENLQARLEAYED